MASAKPAETKKTPGPQSKPTSATPDKRPEDASKDAATASNANLTKKQRKELRRAETQKPTPSLEHQKTAHTEEGSPTKKQSKPEKVSAQHSATKKSKHASEEDPGSKRVQFAMDVKKEDAPSKNGVSSPASSYASYTDTSRKNVTSGAGEHKPALKNKQNKEVHTSTFSPKRSHAAHAEIHSSDAWSDNSDDEGSAIDVSDFAGILPSGLNPGLRGILKNSNRKASSVRRPIYSSTRMQNNAAHNDRDEPMTFTLEDLRRAKHKGYDSAAVHAIGHENGHGTSSTRRNQHNGDGSANVWDASSHHGSAIDPGHSLSKMQTNTLDDRLKAALKQAQANKKANRGDPRYNSRDRSVLSESSSSLNGGLHSAPSSRADPIFVFKPSDAKENDPGIIVHTQAELDAAKREYWRRRTSSSSSFGHSKKARKPSRLSYVQSDSDSNSD